MHFRVRLPRDLQGALRKAESTTLQAHTSELGFNTCTKKPKQLIVFSQEAHYYFSAAIFEIG